jgi:hypothetical protein
MLRAIATIRSHEVSIFIPKRWVSGGDKNLVERGILRAISVRQAYAILHLGKDVENRPMRTHYRGRIRIQASLKIEDDEARKLKLDPDRLPTGAIVGSVEIFDSVQNFKSKWADRGLCSTKARGFRPKSSNTTPPPSSMKCDGPSTLGAHCPTLINGRSRRNRSGPNSRRAPSFNMSGFRF